MTSATVETFHIWVGPTDPAQRLALRVEVEWRGTTYSGVTQLDGLRMRTLQMMVGLLRTNRLIRIDELILLGEHLFVSLFGAQTSEPSRGSPRALFIQAMSDTERGRLTRVSLEISDDVPGLGSWPWEYLFVPDSSGNPRNGFFLGDQLNFVLTRRYPQTSDEKKWENIRPPLRILFVVLSPRSEQGLTEIEYEAVLETLRTLRDAQGRDRIDLRVLTEEMDDVGEPLPEEEIGNTTRTSFAAFRNTVADFEPHVVHVIGHGRFRYEENDSKGEIAFPNTDSTALWKSEWDFSNALRDSRSLRLVFLQACESAATQYSPYEVISGLAVRLAQRNVPAVIAMHFQIKSDLANEFARAFYDKMKERTEIEIAMHAARRQLFVDGAMDEGRRAGFGLPVLYLRESGALLEPLEVPTVLTTETDRPTARDAQPYRDGVHPREAGAGRGDRSRVAGTGRRLDELTGSRAGSSYRTNTESGRDRRQD